MIDEELRRNPVLILLQAHLVQSWEFCFFSCDDSAIDREANMIDGRWGCVNVHVWESATSHAMICQ